MQFTTTFFALLAATALAFPASDAPQRRGFLSDVENGLSGAENDVSSAVKGLTGAASGNCSIVQCAAALGPAAVGCGAAAVQAGVDPISDVACLAAALNDVANPPAACKGCA